MDVGEIETTITRAVVERSTLPPYEELCAVHTALLEHIDALLPLARKQVEALRRGSVEWHEKRSALDTIPHLTSQGLGTGLQSAADHVQCLGRTCQFLLNNAGVVPERPR